MKKRPVSSDGKTPDPDNFSIQLEGEYPRLSLYQRWCEKRFGKSVGFYWKYNGTPFYKLNFEFVYESDYVEFCLVHL